MEIPSIQGFGTEQLLVPLEKPLAVGERKRTLRIGVPKEVSGEERRVALAPYGAGILAAAGHEVSVERSAGDEAHFSDAEYADAGAELVGGAEELYAKSELIVKVFPPSDGELDWLQEKQVLISALHLGNMTPTFLRRLMELRVTGIGFEFIAEPDGTLPIVRMMHEISGSMAIQVAARLLESTQGGRGIVLGGISGVLRALEHYLDRRITTAMANAQYVRQAVQRADVVIGAMMSGGQRSPMLVTREMVAGMRPGAVVIDLVTDQGGCIETSRPTTHSEPTFVEEDVIHYCVPNMPSNAARTATYALTNVLTPYLLDIGEAASINDALWQNTSLRSGTYVYRRHLTKKSLALLFGMPHRDIDLLIASNI